MVMEVQKAWDQCNMDAGCIHVWSKENGGIVTKLNIWYQVKIQNLIKSHAS